MKAFRKHPATYADLQALPEHLVGELIEGELIASPRPAVPHAKVSAVLTSELLGPFQHGRRGGPGGWWILAEPELHLGAQVLVPDLAGWRRETLAELPDAAFISVAPQWVCEVLSPSTAATDRLRKMPIYLREGVIHVWLVDPATRTIEVFRRAGERWEFVSHHVGEQHAGLEPFEALELDLSLLWVSPGEGPGTAG